MNLKTIYNKITGDIRAVSPVVATLVLIVVAIVGAAAVGALTGAFADNVGDQRADVSGAGGTLIIGGSSTIEPLARELARGFMAANPGVRITVQGGGSGAGVAAVGRDAIDIGMASRDLEPAEIAAFPRLRVVQIGSSTVIVVANPTISSTDLNNITISDLRTLFTTGNRTGTVLAANVTARVFRSDRSGTGDEFAKMLGTGATHDTINAAPVGNTTRFAERYNSGVRDRIIATPGAIGAIDLGYITTGVVRATASSLIRDRPLNMITFGEPGHLEQAFFNYARSPVAIPHFETAGVRSLLPMPAR